MGRCPREDGHSNRAEGGGCGMLRIAAHLLFLMTLLFSAGYAAQEGTEEKNRPKLTRKAILQIEEAIAQFRKDHFQGKERINVLQALPFQSPNDPTEYVALVATVDWYNVVYLLKKGSGSYKILWQTEDQREPLLQAQLIAPDSLIQEEVSLGDVDGDGEQELSFLWYGSGGEGSLRVEHATLSLYVPKKNELFSMHAKRQTWPFPPYRLPQYSANALSPSNRVYKTWLEKKGVELGIEEGATIDVHDPNFEVHLWFANNGPLRNGAVRIREYPGEAAYGTNVAAEVIDGDMIWRAYENGPVCGYDRKLDVRYIVYAPENVRRWAKALVADDRFLWIGTLGDGLIRYEKTIRTLRHFLSVDGVSPLPQKISSLDININEKQLIINGSLKVPKDFLTK